jgi:2-polyprenyl-3-methyl-5-hydroxy-6-metoxy-1,4-benzoquinol methylase
MAITCTICGGKPLETSQKIKDHSISGEVFTLSECANCGFEFTSDAPDSKSIVPYYIDDTYISHSDKKSSITDHLYHWARNFMLARKVRLLNSLQKQKGHLLDIGSGTGYFIHQVKQDGWNVQGIEVSESAKGTCRDKFGIEALDNDELWTLEHRSFDAITLWHVLEHVHDLNEYWAQFHNLLKDTGHLIIAVPNIQSKDSKIYQDHWAALDVPRHLWHFKPSDISLLAQNHGFTLVEMKGMPLDAYYVSILSEKYLGHKLALIRGLLNGFRANLLGGVKDKSSIIYILQKK